MIKRIRIQGFKSLEDVTVELGPINVLIGKSGAGKSNFVQAIRWLRNLLTTEDSHNFLVQSRNGNILQFSRNQKSRSLSFEVTCTAPDYSKELRYEIDIQFLDAGFKVVSESLSVSDTIIFSSKQGKWEKRPEVENRSSPGLVALNTLTGIEEVTIAHLLLTHGIGCYSFPDNVLTPTTKDAKPNLVGFDDHGENYLETVQRLRSDLNSIRSIKAIAATIRTLKPTLRSIELEMPSRNQLVATLDFQDHLVTLPLANESEGFRRLFAILLALYQIPPKTTLIFDEPEKGIYASALPLLAEEFHSFADRSRGQIILVTHSPEFLNHFKPEEIRVVEMDGYSTKIGMVSPEQSEAIQEQYLKSGELLTVDAARLAPTAE